MTSYKPTTNPKLYRRAVAALVAVAVSYAALNVAIRLMSPGFGPITQTYLRLLVGVIIALIIFRRQLRLQALRTIPLRDWAVLILMGTVGYSLGVIFVTLGALHAILINVSVLTSTIPFFAAIYAFLVLRKPTPRHLLGFLVLSFIGAAMVATHTFPPALHNLGLGELYVVLSAACFAWFGIGRQLLTRHLNNAEITVATMSIACLSSLIGAVFTGETLHPEAFLNPLVLLGLAIGAICNVMATQFENFAFQHINVVAGSQILLLENAVSPVAGYLLYAEVPTSYEVLGALLIIGSVYSAIRLEAKS
ncbi:MAG TPA: DMT family transporter [Candidatus Saccharimonas sp.]|nr:DMT family transporter [Candidatus Saccharimonas sp.]